MEEQTTKFLGKVLTLSTILVLGVLIFFVGQMVYQFQYLDQQNMNQITVSGEGKVYAQPDIALVSLGVTSQAVTVADATKNNIEKMNAVIAGVKALGVDEKDIQTTNYNLTPVYSSYLRGGSTLNGYKLEQDIQVKIRDFTKISEILSQSTTNGANLVGDLQFTIDNPEQFKEQARQQAIEQAKAKAQSLEKDSGIVLGKIVNIYENYAYPMYDSVKTMSALGGGMESAPSPVIQPGQTEISVTINLSYRVK